MQKVCCTLYDAVHRCWYLESKMLIYSDIKNAKRTALIKHFASLPTPQHALHDRPRSPEFKHWWWRLPDPAHQRDLAVHTYMQARGAILVCYHTAPRGVIFVHPRPKIIECDCVACLRRAPPFVNTHQLRLWMAPDNWSRKIDEVLHRLQNSHKNYINWFMFLFIFG